MAAIHNDSVTLLVNRVRQTLIELFVLDSDFDFSTLGQQAHEHMERYQEKRRVCRANRDAVLLQARPEAGYALEYAKSYTEVMLIHIKLEHLCDRIESDLHQHLKHRIIEDQRCVEETVAKVVTMVMADITAKARDMSVDWRINAMLTKCSALRDDLVALLEDIPVAEEPAPG